MHYRRIDDPNQSGGGMGGEVVLQLPVADLVAGAGDAERAGAIAEIEKAAQPPRRPAGAQQQREVSACRQTAGFTHASAVAVLSSAPPKPITMAGQSTDQDR